MAKTDMISKGLRLLAEIIDIVTEKGEDAGDIRLKDLDGWDDLKETTISEEAVTDFMKKWREARNDE